MQTNNQNFQYKFNFKSIENSILWFKETIKKLWKTPENEQEQSAVNENRVARFEINKQNTFETGKLYLFYYDPKYKNQLPYYDTFPLVLITDIGTNSFSGINLHYIPVEHRMILLSNLSDEKSVYDAENNMYKLYISHKSVKNIQEFSFFEPCFKKYLKSQVRSYIKNIPVEDWGYVAALPIESFVKAPKQTVWTNSLKTQNMTL